MNMEENESVPFLMCLRKPPQSEFVNLQKIDLTSNSFTIGRGLNNSTVIPFLSISRTHCTFKKSLSEWYVEDHSTFGIEINKIKLGKGKTRTVSHDDIISLEPSGEFVFKFIDHSMSNADFDIPRKRMKMENTSNNDNILKDVKMKFEESQKYEIKHIEDKIQNAKQMQTTSKILKEQLQSDMNRKLEILKSEFASQIGNLKGEKNEVERQKALLIEERDAQLASVKNEMQSKIAELMAQIQKHNEAESELLNENNSLKEKLRKEREEFLSELDRESTSKQEMLEKLESKIQEQEEVRLKEKQELETMLKMEMEQLRIAKEKELKELEEQKKLREKELQQELENIKKDLQMQMEQTEQEKVKAAQLLNEKMEQMKKYSNEEKAKIEQFELERQEMEKKHSEAEIHAQKSLDELKERVMERETQLAALAADRIQKQAEQSGEVISTLQEQLEKVKKQLEDVKSEKDTLLENLCLPESGEVSTKQATLTVVGELMENELQCSICAELFVSAITLNCSHTFCKYCITKWKKKKKDCPICRASITSECRSLVLDSFIEKMVQNLTEEMKVKRQEMLQYREELMLELARQTSAEINRGGVGYDGSYQNTDSDDLEAEEEGEYIEELFESDTDWTDRGFGLNSSSQYGEVRPDDAYWAEHGQYYEVESDDNWTERGQYYDEFESDSDWTDRGQYYDEVESDGNWSERGQYYHEVEFDSNRTEHGLDPNFYSSRFYPGSDRDSGPYEQQYSYNEHDASQRVRAAARAAAAEPSAAPPTGSAAPALTAGGAVPTAGEHAAVSSNVSHNTERRANADGVGERRRRRRRVSNVSGAYYGGYGRCYICGVHGHWAPGCPNR